MDIEAKREKVMAAYPSRKWATKVRQMTEVQVTAIFLRLKQQNKI